MSAGLRGGVGRGGGVAAGATSLCSNEVVVPVIPLLEVVTCPLDLVVLRDLVVPGPVSAGTALVLELNVLKAQALRSVKIATVRELVISPQLILYRPMTQFFEYVLLLCYERISISKSQIYLLTEDRIIVKAYLPSTYDEGLFFVLC